MRRFHTTIHLIIFAENEEEANDITNAAAESIDQDTDVVFTFCTMEAEEENHT